MNLIIPDETLTTSEMFEADLKLKVALIFYKRRRSVQAKLLNE